MPIYKYKTFQKAQEAQWEYHPDQRYYKKLRELFAFLNYLPIQKSPRGIFRYPSLEAAAEQEIAWKVMAPTAFYKKNRGKKRQENKNKD